VPGGPKTEDRKTNKTGQQRRPRTREPGGLPAGNARPFNGGRDDRERDVEKRLAETGEGGSKHKGALPPDRKRKSEGEEGFPRKTRRSVEKWKSSLTPNRLSRKAFRTNKSGRERTGEKNTATTKRKEGGAGGGKRSPLKESYNREQGLLTGRRSREEMRRRRGKNRQRGDRGRGRSLSPPNP